MGRVSPIEWMERFQVPLYLAALGAGAIVGLALPAVAGPAEAAINPVLGLLLYATFLGIPFAKLGGALRDWRFLATVLVANFAVAPLIAWAVAFPLGWDRGLLVGALLVLLTPCVDYVIVFTGLAGGSRERLLAATPLLMLLQMVLLPGYLWVMAGPEVVAAVDLEPFIEAFLLLIALPLVLAGITQALAARFRSAERVRDGVQAAMVPLMMLTLAVVVASQVAGLGSRLGQVMWAVPVYVLFAVLMTAVGMGASRVARLDVPGRRAAVFSGVTRNSLVVLPLALALPAEFALAPLAVVTQTLVELVLMVIGVVLVPKLLPMKRDS